MLRGGVSATCALIRELSSAGGLVRLLARRLVVKREQGLAFGAASKSLAANMPRDKVLGEGLLEV